VKLPTSMMAAPIRSRVTGRSSGRSLPENALVTKATLTLEPRLPPGNVPYIETLRFTGGAAYGAMIRPAADGIAEIDFHARRTPVAFTGLAAQASATLSVDIAGQRLSGGQPGRHDSEHHGEQVRSNPVVRTCRIGASRIALRTSRM